MEIVKKDQGFDPVATADIVTFDLEEMQLLHEIEAGNDVDMAAKTLKLDEDVLGRCVQNLVVNLPDKSNLVAVSLAKAQLKALRKK
ncbi:MAG: hypothetical protein K8F91_10880 [Candidatus Obscuribacterales bacterium]|nr:hypothetical protein [Candidatus Obscuribacterales bacterium]